MFQVQEISSCDGNTLILDVEGNVFGIIKRIDECELYINDITEMSMYKELRDSNDIPIEDLYQQNISNLFKIDSKLFKNVKVKRICAIDSDKCMAILENENIVTWSLKKVYPELINDDSNDPIEKKRIEIGYYKIQESNQILIPDHDYNNFVNFKTFYKSITSYIDKYTIILKNNTNLIFEDHMSTIDSNNNIKQIVMNDNYIFYLTNAGLIYRYSTTNEKIHLFKESKFKSICLSKFKILLLSQKNEFYIFDVFKLSSLKDAIQIEDTNNHVSKIRTTPDVPYDFNYETIKIQQNNDLFIIFTKMNEQSNIWIIGDYLTLDVVNEESPYSNDRVKSTYIRKNTSTQLINPYETILHSLKIVDVYLAPVSKQTIFFKTETNELYLFSFCWYTVSTMGLDNSRIGKLTKLKKKQARLKKIPYSYHYDSPMYVQTAKPYIVKSLPNSSTKVYLNSGFNDVSIEF